MNNIGYLLTLSYHLKFSLAPKYLVHVILRPHSASFNRPLRSFRRLLDDGTFVLGDTVVRPADTIRNLGVQFDSCMTMTAHVSQLVRGCFYHLRRIKTIHKLIPTSAAVVLVNSFVVSRVDYCNSML